MTARERRLERRLIWMRERWKIAMSIHGVAETVALLMRCKRAERKERSAA